MFDIMVWGGAALSLIGLIGLILSIIRVVRARRADMNDEDLRDVLKGVLPLNIGSLFLSVIGLMLVMVGLSLG